MLFSKRFSFLSISASKYRWLIISIISPVLLLTTLFVIRGVILREYTARKVKYIEEKHNLKISYSSLQMSEWNKIDLRELALVPMECDTLMKAASITIKVDLSKLLLSHIEITHATCDSLKFDFIKSKEHSNFDFLYTHTSNKNDSLQIHTSNYGKQADRILTMLFGLLPANATVNNLNINYQNNDYNISIVTPLLTIIEGNYKTIIYSNEKGIKSKWTSEGSIEHRKRNIKGVLYSNKGSKNELPFLQYRWDTKISFDTVKFELSNIQYKNRALWIDGNAGLSGFNLHQPRISSDNVILNRASIEYHINIRENGIELDSTSTIHINNLPIHPYLLVERLPQWHIIAAIDEHHFDAKHLFESLPTGLFENIEGIKTKGKLSYHFLLDVDFSKPDSLLLESELKREKFGIEKFGKTNLCRMNESFNHTVYEQGVPVRSFIVGEENPQYRSLNKIATVLQMCVLQSEDGEFFHHNGFLIEHIRTALAHDIIKKRFARGGSTISMQLVKNVFLNRNKTLARKLEEGLIVWLIEGEHLTSKERMFEIYLNIIEWGPNIYGIAEASHYYFDKEPSALTANESIFLSSIIPRPKGALYNFTENFSLKPHLTNYYTLMAERLCIKGIISSADEKEIRPDITLKGNARTAVSNLYKISEEIIEIE